MIEPGLIRPHSFEPGKNMSFISSLNNHIITSLWMEEMAHSVQAWGPESGLHVESHVQQHLLVISTLGSWRSKDCCRLPDQSTWPNWWAPDPVTGPILKLRWSPTEEDSRYQPLAIMHTCTNVYRILQTNMYIRTHANTQSNYGLHLDSEDVRYLNPCNNS